MVDLTPAQADAVARGGSFCILGEAGTGKTTALLERYLQKARASRSGRTLVLCRDAAAATRFRHEAVRHLAGGFDSLAITTVWALAFRIVTNSASDPEPLRLLTGAERRQSIVRQLADEAASAGAARLWPSLSHVIGRRAFVDAVDRGRNALATRDPEATLPDGDDAGPWHELAAFAARFDERCRAAGVVDAGSVIPQAARLLGDPVVAAAEAARLDEILVDDTEGATPAMASLLHRLTAPGATPLVAARNSAGWPSGWPAATAAWPDWPTVTFDVAFRQPAEPELIECRHPSVEPEAIAGELIRAHDRGVPWRDMAVLAPAADLDTIIRAMARHDIPAVTTRRHRVADDPLTRAIVDLVAWAGGDGEVLPRLLSSPVAGLDGAGARDVQRRARAEGVQLVDLPALATLLEARDAVAAALDAGDALAPYHEAFRRAAAGMVRLPGAPAAPVEERSLDAAVAFLKGLERGHAPGSLDTEPDTEPDTEIDVYPWWGEDDEPAAGPSGVTLTSIAGAAGREWPLVIVAGCVEGRLPRLRPSTGLFHAAPLLRGPETRGDHLRHQLDDERRRFATACSRATTTLLATAATEPGVLVSRFVAGWPRRAPTVPLDAPDTPDAPASVPESEGTGAVWPGGSLLLSASQLDTFEDCPLKYAFRYAAGVRTDAGLHADLGTVVHDALARFLDPSAEIPCTYEALLEVADECWRDDIAPYRPQVEEARRDYYDMLELWWQQEGEQIASGAIEVLATEHPFEVEIGPHRITGRIDRVDRTPDGAGIRVLDYKTGKSRPRPADVAANIQLSTYHLAARRDDELRSWGEPTELRLLYVRSMQPYDQEVAADHEAVTEARILETAARILAEEFEPSAAADCDHCEFHRLCPLWPEGLEVGER